VKLPIEVTTWICGEAPGVAGTVAAAGLGCALAAAAGAAAVPSAGLGGGAGAGVAAGVAAPAGGASAAKLRAGQVAQMNPRTSSSCFISEILLE